MDFNRCYASKNILKNLLDLHHALTGFPKMYPYLTTQDKNVSKCALYPRDNQHVPSYHLGDIYGSEIGASKADWG